GVEAVSELRDGHMVEQRGEPRPLPLPCRDSHTAQAARLVVPALCPGRGRLRRVLLGRPPSLLPLRGRRAAPVRVIRRYYAAVRLPTDVRAGRAAHRLLQPARPRLAW